ncbi:phosphotransferase [Clostridium sp. MB05]
MSTFLKNNELTKLGGLNNSNYLLKSNNKKYVLRIPGKDNKNNFYYENSILNLVQPLNICPDIIYHSKDNGILISKFIESSQISIDIYNSKNFLNTLTFTLKKLHNLEYNNNFNPFEVIENNINFLINDKFDFNHNINQILKKLKYLEKKLTKEITYGLCHNDLNISNILYSNEKVYFIDFEFSGMGDIFFDLATLSWFLNEDMKVKLLKNYFGHYSLEQKEKLEDYLFIVKLWNATWSFIKSINSTSDYDYKIGGNMILDDLMNSL